MLQLVQNRCVYTLWPSLEPEAFNRCCQSNDRVQRDTASLHRGARSGRGHLSRPPLGGDFTPPHSQLHKQWEVDALHNRTRGGTGRCLNTLEANGGVRGRLCEIYQPQLSSFSLSGPRSLDQAHLTPAHKTAGKIPFTFKFEPKMEMFSALESQVPEHFFHPHFISLATRQNKTHALHVVCCLL